MPEPRRDKDDVAFLLIAVLCLFVFSVNFFSPQNIVGTVEKNIGNLCGLIITFLTFYERMIGFSSHRNDSSRSSRQDTSRSRDAKGRVAPVHVQIEHGMYGGIAGGMVVGFLIGVGYYENMYGPFSFLDAIWIIMPILALTAFSGGVLGVFIEAALCVGDRIYNNDGRLREIFPRIALCTIGGLITGAIVGPMNGLFFGQMNRHVADWGVIVIAAIPGMLIVTISLFSRQSNKANWSVSRVAFMALIFSAMVAGIGVEIGLLLGVFGFITALFIASVLWAKALGGLIFGLFCGFVFGSGIGTSLVVGSTVVKVRPGGETAS